LPRQKFSRSDRLKRQSDFHLLKTKGLRFHRPEFILNALESEGTHSRLGIVASRRVGNAVTRNLLKRRVREIFRQRDRSLYHHPADWVVVLRKGAVEASFDELRFSILKGMAVLSQKLDKTGNLP